LRVLASHRSRWRLAAPRCGSCLMLLPLDRSRLIFVVAELRGTLLMSSHALLLILASLKMLDLKSLGRLCRKSRHESNMCRLLLQMPPPIGPFFIVHDPYHLALGSFGFTTGHSATYTTTPIPPHSLRARPRPDTKPTRQPSQPLGPRYRSRGLTHKHLEATHREPISHIS